MTLRTITYDTAQYKLVPVEPTEEWVERFKGILAFPDAAEIILRAMLIAVPDTLPGVVEHSGEPVAWIRFRSDGHYEGPVHDRYLDDIRRKSGSWTPLFTHPAPARPVRQELSISDLKNIAGVAVKEFRVILTFCSCRSAEEFARTILAKDRG